MTKVCHRHPTHGLPALAEIEDRSQVDRAPPDHAVADGQGKQAPPKGVATTIIPISGRHHRRRQGQALRAACGRP